jgi:hypothetical protein
MSIVAYPTIRKIGKQTAGSTPPQTDRVYAVDDYPAVLRYNSFKHNTYIANNGAIEIRAIASGVIEFSKAGANGKGVWNE